MNIAWARRTMMLLGLALVWLGADSALAAEPQPGATSDPLSFVADYLCCRPNYCKKPLPCLGCFCPGTSPDCYCSKPLPFVCIGCVPSSCDNYCRKPLPACLPPPLCSDGCRK